MVVKFYSDDVGLDTDTPLAENSVQEGRLSFSKRFSNQTADQHIVSNRPPHLSDTVSPDFFALRAGVTEAERYLVAAFVDAGYTPYGINRTRKERLFKRGNTIERTALSIKRDEDVVKALQDADLGIKFCERRP